MFADGSICSLSVGYAFHIPKLHISFSNYLPPIASSFTAKYFTIFEAL